jgi:hypothetical protein
LFGFIPVHSVPGSYLLFVVLVPFEVVPWLYLGTVVYTIVDTRPRLAPHLLLLREVVGAKIFRLFSESGRRTSRHS